MPLFLKIPGALSSNKQGKVEWSRICYRVIDGKVAILKPLIDRLSITYLIKDPDLLGAVIDSLLSPDEDLPIKSYKFASGKQLYKASVQLTAQSGERAYLQVGPKSPKIVGHSLRLEFNPAKLGPSGIEFLASVIENLVPNGLTFAKILAHGRITRVDLAIDVVGIKPDQLYVSSSAGGTSHFYVNESEMQSVYVGMKKTVKNKNCPVVLYNKRKQSKEAGGNAPYGGASCSRIERRLKPGKGILDLIFSKGNPFSEISACFPIKAPAGIKSFDWKFFICACICWGEERALDQVTCEKRKYKYEAALQKARGDFWNPEKLWNSWGAVFADCGFNEYVGLCAVKDL